MREAGREWNMLRASFTSRSYGYFTQPELMPNKFSNPRPKSHVHLGSKSVQKLTPIASKVGVILVILFALHLEVFERLDRFCTHSVHLNHNNESYICIQIQ
jgi:hypothetical protein